ncbi:TPA: BspA family leucine-rich repeat surface protein [Enterococcus faecalis]
MNKKLIAFTGITISSLMLFSTVLAETVTQEPMQIKDSSSVEDNFSTTLLESSMSNEVPNFSEESATRVTNEGNQVGESTEYNNNVILKQTEESELMSDNVPKDNEPKDIFISGSIGTSQWELDNEGVLKVGPGEFDNQASFNLGIYITSVKSVIFEGEVTAGTYLVGLFRDMRNLTKIENLNFLDTSKVTSMNQMFSGCVSLTSLDVSKFDTSNVVNMDEMFGNCRNLTSLDVSGFNTEKVQTMSSMFFDCRSLTSLDVSKFDTSSVVNMDSMFAYCMGLTSLDVSGFNTGNVTNMSYMFSSCSNLTSLDVSGFNTGNVTNMSSMFRGCSNLTSLDVSGFNTGNVTNMSSMFISCSNLTSIDVSGFDTSSVVNMSSMFAYCMGLTSIDVSGFNTGNVTNMSSMFSSCSNLTSIDVSGFDTGNVTNMSSMFSNCSNLTSIDVSGFDTGNVTNMSSMFIYCSNLTSIDVSGFDTGNVTNMQFMFTSCSKLNPIVLGEKFKMDRVGLPSIKETKEFTGKWQNIGEGTKDRPTGKNVWTSEELMTQYDGSKDADTYVWQPVNNEVLVVEIKEGTVPLGTTGNLINPQEFVKTVRLGERELSSDEYTVELTNKPYTSKIGKYDCKIKVTLRDSPDKEVESDVKANIVWGSSIVSKARSTGAIDSSVSLLDNNGVPYLKATEGNGFSRQGHLLSRPRFDVYREAQGNKIFSVTNGTVKNTPQKLMNIWNGYFSNAEFKYGDVMSYTVYNYGNASANENGKNTWVSRNNSLTRETQGYRDAFYEFTKNGLRLMQINQLKITNGNRVPLNTTKEEMNQNIDKYISIPTHIKNPEDYRMEFESIDTTTSGNKTSKINVYQQLQSGGEFKMSYSVNYTVNPTIEETSYDAKGNAISDVKKTTFDFGKEYRPNPEKYINKDDELYVYQGWLEYPMTPGKDTPNQGVPNATKVERKLYYIYEKADKYINVTIPTEIVFGTFDDTEEVKSNKYEIKNNSKELTTNVSLESFQGSSTSVKLLGENEAPDETKDSARLNLLINDESKIKGLNEAKFNISLADLEPENTATMGINGEYYARTSQIHIVEYNTKLKFKAVSGK